MRQILPFITLLAITISIPTQFDLRVQSSLIRYTDYSIHHEGLCGGYAWAKQLAQVVSNAISLQESIRISLSAQQILECTSTQEDKCYKGTKQNILDAMARLEKYGITTSDCYQNRPLQYPSTCKRVCHNGQKFDFVYKFNFVKYTNALELFDLFKKNEKIAVFAIVKADDSFNFYNSFNQQLQKKPSQFYEYRVAEILGWKEQQKKIILRAGLGQQWGFNGFIDLPLTPYGSSYIQEYYLVSMHYCANIRTQTA